MMTMMKRFQMTSIFPILLLCAILILVTACSTQPIGGPGGNPTPTSTASGNGGTPASGGSSTPVQTVQMPSTQTSCPAAGTARAAVMRPLQLGHDQNLVYVYNEVPQNTTIAYGHVRRYNRTTGQKIDIATSGIRIDQAQVSADGQWVLFLSIPDPRGDSQHSALLQLVRMDGQGLQTLYCFPATTYPIQTNSSKLPISLQWSVNQQSIIFSVSTGSTSSTTSRIELLNLSSGALTPLFQDPNDSLYSYSVVTWLDNTHAYVIKQGNSAPTPPATVFLMNTSTATPANPGLTQIMTTTTRMSYYSLDSSPDGRQLYSSSCLMAANPFNTSIMSGPATGGTRSTLFQGSPLDCVQVLRAISPGKLLALAQVSTNAGNAFSNDVWTMNTTPGSSYNVLSLLSVSPDDQTRYDFNETSQFIWSNVSRDNASYALQAINPSANTQSIMIGSLSSGNVTTVATTNPGLSSVSLAGWTTF